MKTDPVVVLECMTEGEVVEVTIADPDVDGLMEAFFRFMKGSGFPVPVAAEGITFYYGEGDTPSSNDGDVH